MSGYQFRIRRYNRRFLRQLRSHPHLDGITILLEPDPCQVCLAAVETSGDGTLPELPIESCLKIEGCTCRYAGVLASSSSQPSSR